MWGVRFASPCAISVSIFFLKYDFDNLVVCIMLVGSGGAVWGDFTSTIVVRGPWLHQWMGRNCSCCVSTVTPRFLSLEVLQLLQSPIGVLWGFNISNWWCRTPDQVITKTLKGRMDWVVEFLDLRLCVSSWCSSTLFIWVSEAFNAHCALGYQISIVCCKFNFCCSLELILNLGLVAHWMYSEVFFVDYFDIIETT